MKLYVIGNGFDIGHGLPTLYWDFRSFLNKVHPDFLELFEKNYNIYPGMEDSQKQALLWNRFEANLANIDEDTIIESGTSLELDLESGDIGIEDTMYTFFSEQYAYIEKLAKYLKEWVRSIRIRDCLPRTTQIGRSCEDLFVTFNYTAVLENVYHILPSQIIHIHGSLQEYTIDPVIGHGNQMRLQRIQEKIDEAESLFDEKWSSICRVVKDYYTRTFKDISRYALALALLCGKAVDEIVVIGHSMEGIDIPYFPLMDMYTGKSAAWTVYCFDMEEAPRKKQTLVETGIEEHRIQVKPSTDFYDLSDEGCVRQYADYLKRSSKAMSPFGVDGLLQN
jgi:hypothetical protein